MSIQSSTRSMPVKILALCMAVLVAAMISGCAESDGSVKEQDKNLLAKKSRAEFNQKVIPILEKRCSVACHAVAENAFASFMQDPIHKISLYFPFDSESGKIPPQHYETVFETLTGNHRLDYSAEGKFSHLVRVPLAEEHGGLPHKGLDVFYSIDDEDYKTIVQWIGLEVSSRPKTQEPLPANVAYFRDSVLGMMERNGCFGSSCHGNQVFSDLKLTPPLPAVSVGKSGDVASRFSTEMVLANRKAVMGTVARFINFNGDLTQSRLIRKNLPIAEGGIHQRGGNIQFFESLQDQDVQIFLEWFRLERDALVAQSTSGRKPIEPADVGELQGLVFVRGPRHTPRKFFDFDPFYPGSNIFLLRVGEGETIDATQSVPVNLTAALTEGRKVEIQSLDVRYDARRILFSMRKGKDEGFRIYEITLNKQRDGVEGEIRQLSFAPARLPDGTLIHHIDPVYIPGPEDRKGYQLDDVAIAFASNEAGGYALSDTFGVMGEVDAGQGATIRDQKRPEAPGTFTGKKIQFVSGANKGEWRKILLHRAIGGAGSGSEFVLDSPLPAPIVENTTTYVIESEQADLKSSFDIWRMVPAKDGAEQSNQERFAETARRMTFSRAQERAVTTRTSGEVMFTSVRNVGYQGDKPVFNGAIYRVQAGGFDYHIHGGNRSGYPLFSDSRETGSGLELRQVHDPRNLWRGGLLVLSDHGFGVNIESANPADNTPYAFGRDNSDINFSSPPRFIPAMAYFFPENGVNAVTHTGKSPGGSVREPYPLQDDSVLVSYTPDALNHLDPNADPDWDIYRFDFVNSVQGASGERTGKFEKLRIAAASSELAEYSARPLMIRFKENPNAPIHHQKFGSIGDAQKPVDEWGVLRYPQGLPGEIECYDYPLLQSFLTNFQPTEAKDFHLKEANPNGAVTPEDQVFRYVRIIMQSPTKKELLTPTQAAADPFATPVSLGIHTQRVIVSEVPIEDDGSFYAEAPTEVPLLVQGLNKDRMALHSMNRWFYLQPGEKLTFSIPRSIFPLRCTGCHGALTGEPTEGVGPVDLYTASSAVMATWNDLDGVRRQPYGHGNTASNYIAVDYLRDVQPIFDKHCTACHDGASAGPDLRNIKTDFYNLSYENLHRLRDPESGNFADKQYINEREALSSESPLIRMMVQDAGKQHMNGNRLSDAEMLTLIRWIDLGATFKGGFAHE